MNKHERRLQLAMRMAHKAPKQRQRVGCVIYKKGRVVGVGYNTIGKTHPKSNTPYQMTHAELHAVLGVPAEDLYGSKVYVARTRATGPGLARPCAACMNILTDVGVNMIYYTGYDNTILSEKL